MNAQSLSPPRVALVSALALTQVLVGVPLWAPTPAQAQLPEPTVWIAPLKTEGAAGLGLLSEKLDEATRVQLLRSTKLDLTEQQKGSTVVAGQSDPRVEQAENLRVAGKASFVAGKFKEAQKQLGAALGLYLEGLASVNRIEVIAETLGLLGAAAVELDFDADAQDYFNRVVALVPDAEPLEEYSVRARTVFEATKGKLLKKKRGTLTVTTVPAGAEVRVDGIDRGRSPVTVKDLVRGQHFVQASSDAAGIAGLALRVKGGGASNIALTLEQSIGPKAAAAADPGLVTELRRLAGEGRITHEFRDQAEAIASQTKADYVVVAHIEPQGNNFVLRGYLYGVEQKQTAAFDELQFRADLASVFVQASNFATTIERAVERFPFDKVVVGQVVVAAPVVKPPPAPPSPRVLASAPPPRPDPAPGITAATPPPARPQPPKDEDDEGGWYTRWWVWTLIGVAVAGGAVGVGYALSQGEPAAGNSFDAEVRW